MSTFSFVWPFVVAIPGFLGAWQLARRAPSARLAWVFTAALWLAWGAGMYFMDTEIPLSESHFRAGGEPVPLWLALIVLMTGSAKIAALLGAASRENGTLDRGQP